MEVHQIRYFLAVVANRHFGRAAIECNVTQPALTRAIQKLEDELGGPMLSRRPNQIDLTALGRQVFPHLKQAYEETMQAKLQARAFGTQQRTKLRIGVMCTIGPWMLAELLPKVIKRLPLLDIALTQATGYELVEALATDDIDVAIVGLPDYPASIAAQALFREPYVIAFPRGHRFEAMIDVPISELATETYLERMNCEFIDFYERAYGEWTVQFRGQHESESEDWIQAMIEAGVGCAIVPKNFPLLPSIVTRPLSEPMVDRAISLIYNRSRDGLAANPANAFISVVSNVGWHPSV